MAVADASGWASFQQSVKKCCRVVEGVGRELERNHLITGSVSQLTGWHFDIDSLFHQGDIHRRPPEMKSVAGIYRSAVRLRLRSFSNFSGFPSDCVLASPKDELEKWKPKADLTILLDGWHTEKGNLKCLVPLVASRWMENVVLLCTCRCSWLK